MNYLSSFLFVVLVLVLRPPALSAAMGTNAFDPGVPLSIAETNAIRSAASNSLVEFRAHITPANHQMMGFNSFAEVSAATNGNPLLVFTVPMNRLTNYMAVDDLDSLLEPPAGSRTPHRAFVPIMVGTNVRSSVLLRLPRGAAGMAAGWGGKDWGQPKVIRNLVATSQAIANSDLKPNTVPFAVEIPMPRIWLVGYYDTKDKLTFRSTIDLHLGPINLNRNQIVTQQDMEKIAAEARRYNPNLPN